MIIPIWYSFFMHTTFKILHLPKSANCKWIILHVIQYSSRSFCALGRSLLTLILAERTARRSLPSWGRPGRLELGKQNYNFWILIYNKADEACSCGGGIIKSRSGLCMLRSDFRGTTWRNVGRPSWKFVSVLSQLWTGAAAVSHGLIESIPDFTTNCKCKLLIL